MLKKNGTSTENWLLGISGKCIIPSPISKSHLEKLGSVIARILCFNLNVKNKWPNRRFFDC